MGSSWVCMNCGKEGYGTKPHGSCPDSNSGKHACREIDIKYHT